MARRWGSSGGWQYFPPSVPRAAKDGIKARSRRGDFGATWWGKRWIAVLEGFGWSARLQRGRRYARLGQVLDFRLAPGAVEAKVQGSRPQPYKVKIAVRPLPPQTWGRVAMVLGSRAAFSAALLSGDMPEGIEEAFKEARAPMFPKSNDDFETDCSCPDWANPCKHIAAVHYIIGEAFDRDPFLLFALRGMPKEELIASLRHGRAREPRAPTEPLGSADRAVEDRPEPLPADPLAFWGAGRGEQRFDPGVTEPPVADAVLRRLGEPAVLRGSPEVMRGLRRAYETIGQRALEAAMGAGETRASARAETRGRQGTPTKPRKR